MVLLLTFSSCKACNHDKDEGKDKTRSRPVVKPDKSRAVVKPNNKEKRTIARVLARAAVFAAQTARTNGNMEEAEIKVNEAMAKATEARALDAAGDLIVIEQVAKAVSSGAQAVDEATFAVELAKGVAWRKAASARKDRPKANALVEERITATRAYMTAYKDWTQMREALREVAADEQANGKLDAEDVEVIAEEARTLETYVATQESRKATLAAWFETEKAVTKAKEARMAAGLSGDED